MARENVKSKKSLTQYIKETWGTMKRSNLRIIGIKEGEDSQIKNPENIVNKITEENFPSLKKAMPIKVQEAYKTPNRLNQKKVPTPYNNQNTKHREQRKNIKSCKRKRLSNI